MDARAVANTATLAVTVYALTTDLAMLTAAQRTAMTIYMDQRQNKIAGTSVSVAATTELAYTIVATINFQSGVVDPDTLEASVRESVYALIRSRSRLGDGLPLSAITAALVVSGVTNVALSTPASDIAGVDSQRLTCAQDATDVVLTMTGV